MVSDALFASLNASQRAAVSSSADTLAILAGPGSGKTHTLTSRTAWLLRQGLQPWNIIVATFTVKASREMKERIGKLIGDGEESKLILGTFHSIARRYLARYGHLVGIPKDFGIADAGDSLAILKRIVKRHRLTIDPKVARSRISSLKAKGPEHDERPAKKSVEAQEFETCSIEYQAALQRANLLDYDDLLVRCVELLRTHPSCVSNVEAVLIDEFQDTNTVQFDLMRLFAAERKRITIVGDPDQSIYGFRAAETKNYKRMLHQYPETVTIPLEENYRSSGAILLTALCIIEQDAGRIAKSLMATHTVGTRPVLRKLAGAQKEAQWIVSEIQRCMGLTGDLLDLNDFAILVRSSALSRLIESALGKAGIAYRMVGGMKFYDRVEVKTILDYLRVVNLPDNNDALVRIINTPSRRIGESTIKALLEEADTSKVTLWSLVLDAVQGTRTIKTKLQKSTEQSLSLFVNIILTARNKMANKTASEHLSIVDLIDIILKKTSFEEWLERAHDDLNKARWANVQELLALASDFESQIEPEDEMLPVIDGLDQADEADPLSRFLANVALAAEVKKDGDEVAQVTISTIHAAKGLEWPIVFIPGTFQGSVPHSRADDNDEERRLLYVAMTRAKALLYMSCPLRDSQGSETTLSPFLSPRSLTPHLDKSGPSIGSDVLKSISSILRRPLPSQESIKTSSKSIEFCEDTQFPIADVDTDQSAQLSTAQIEQTVSFSKDQRGMKRQRADQDFHSAGSAKLWKTGHVTTMDRVKGWTPDAAVAGFVTAGSHHQALGQMPSAVVPPAVEDESKLMRSYKGKVDRSTRQKTLRGYLGQAEPPSDRASLPAKSGIPVVPSIGGRHPPMRTTPRPILDSGDSGISPALSNHRLGTANAMSRPRPSAQVEKHEHTFYPHFSSSPPRAKAASPEPDPPAPPPKTSAMSANLPLARPAATMHTTTVMTLGPGSNNSNKTLGVRRSMNGWSNRKGQRFVPPTRKQPE